jgi:uncharacterized protein
MIDLETARAWYPTGDTVHGFDHIERVLRLAERLAAAEGADVEIVRAAVLLHDAQDPAVSSHGEAEQRPSHQHASAAFARRLLLALGWKPERVEAVVHCIRSHRFRDTSEQPATLEAQILFDADKLDAIGAVGAARAVAYAAQAGQPFYAQPSATFLASGERQPDEPHSAYHEHVYKLVRLKERMYTSTAHNLAEERHKVMCTFFERLQAEAQGQA